MRIGKVFVLISATFSLSCSNLANAKEEGFTPEEIVNLLSSMGMDRDESEVLDGAHGQHEASTSTSLTLNHDDSENKFLQQYTFYAASNSLAWVKANEALSDLRKEVESVRYVEVIPENIATSIVKHIKITTVWIQKLQKEFRNEQDASLLKAYFEELNPMIDELRKMEVLNTEAAASLEEAIKQLEKKIAGARAALGNAKEVGL